MDLLSRKAQKRKLQINGRRQIIRSSKTIIIRSNVRPSLACQLPLILVRTLMGTKLGVKTPPSQKTDPTTHQGRSTQTSHSLLPHVPWITSTSRSKSAPPRFRLALRSLSEERASLAPLSRPLLRFLASPSGGNQIGSF